MFKNAFKKCVIDPDQPTDEIAHENVKQLIFLQVNSVKKQFNCCEAFFRYCNVHKTVTSSRPDVDALIY